MLLGHMFIHASTTHLLQSRAHDFSKVSLQVLVSMSCKPGVLLRSGLKQRLIKLLTREGISDTYLILRIERDDTSFMRPNYDFASFYDVWVRFSLQLVGDEKQKKAPL